MPLRSEPQPGLGHAVRQRREHLGLTQKDAANLADVHPTWWSRLESGERNPTWGTVTRIAAALNTTVADLAASAERGHLTDP